jgi:two-component system cell cycle sensor histidine kinase/response regulator CckA
LINCAEFMTKIGNYLEGEVAEEVRFQLEHHLAHCQICTVLVNSTRKTTFLDITERRQLQEQLRQAQKLESVGRLAGGVAHDFNNLLTVINRYSDLSLRQLRPSDPMHHNLSQIREAGQHAAELVRQLLLLSHKHVIQMSEVNLNDVVIDVTRMLARIIGEDIRLESVLSPFPAWVLADAGQLHQILMNLAVNAGMPCQAAESF